MTAYARNLEADQRRRDSHGDRSSRVPEPDHSPPHLAGVGAADQLLALWAVGRLARWVTAGARIVRPLAAVPRTEVRVRKGGTGASREQASGDHHRGNESTDHAIPLRLEQGRWCTMCSELLTPQSESSVKDLCNMYFYTSECRTYLARRVIQTGLYDRWASW